MPIHLTGDARIMDHEDRLCPLRDGIFYFRFVNVQGVRTDVHEDRFRSEPRHRGRRRDKCIRRHNDFIARFQLTKLSGHFQSSCARWSQQHSVNPESLLEQFGTLLSKMTVTTKGCPSSLPERYRTIPCRQRTDD